MRLCRRSLLKLTAGGLLVPSAALGAASPERKFLFVFADGGWDILKVFAPLFDTVGVELDDDAELSEAGGLSWVSSATRPAVDTFFSRWGEQAAILHGMEVRSITHERCTRIAFTGSGNAGDDWGTLLAAHSASSELLLPYLVLDGKAFTSRYSSMVVRTGEDDQLPELLDGRILGRSDDPFTALGADARTEVDAYLARRLEGFGRHEAQQDFAERYALVQAQAQALREVESLSLETAWTGCSRDLTADAAVAATCFEQGLARCALVRSQGWCEEGWDTHERNELQDDNFDELFGHLDAIMSDLSSRTGQGGGSLLDEVTVVVLSEMGRYPVFNGAGGRDHWTYTSCMLLGSGIRGGQVLGGFGENMVGEAMALSTGEVSSSGTLLTPGNLGATLLALGDVDPGEHVDEQPITALLS